MKKMLQYSLSIILAGVTSFTSCKKEKPVAPFVNPPPPPPQWTERSDADTACRNKRQ